MIKLYVASGCTSCAKAKSWLEEQKLIYSEKNICHDILTKDEIKEILTLTNQGIQDIIAYHSETYKKLKCTMNNLSLDELMDLLIKQPSLIRHPIILDDRRLQIGYNQDEMCVFLPREIHELRFSKIWKAIAHVQSTI